MYPPKNILKSDRIKAFRMTYDYIISNRPATIGIKTYYAMIDDTIKKGRAKKHNNTYNYNQFLKEIIKGE